MEASGYRYDPRLLQLLQKKCNNLCENSENVKKYPGESNGMNSRADRKKMLAKAASIYFPYCPDVAKYKKIIKIGQGTFGEVFKARDRKSQKFVALKKILMENEKEGFPITAIREIKILKQLKHKHIVNLIEICSYNEETPGRCAYKPSFYLVFDFCEHDLAGLINNSNVKFSLAEIKTIVKQLLQGLYFMHSHNIIHRDMKSANILITKEGILKIADFGLSRAFSTQRRPKFTNRVVTLWYRPPELLLGDQDYGPPIDLWGAGCIMAEMWTRIPILQGQTEQHQIKLISDLCGSITPETLPGIEKLELFSKLVLPTGLNRKVKERLRVHVKEEDALELIDKLLMIDPNNRIDADNALSHDFFYNIPSPCSLEKLLAGIPKSQFEYHGKINAQSAVAVPQRKKNEGEYVEVIY